MSRTPRGPGGMGGKRNMMKTFMMMKMFSEMMDGGNGIQKRAADDDVYDLGSKLHEKLELKMEWDEMKNKIEDDWLRSQLEKYCDQCIEFAENLPQSMLDDCPWGGEMVKTKMYMKCMMKKKVKTCMRKDIKDKLEEHFGGVDKLVKETKIPEYELYEIVKQMLKGPEMMMMEMS